MRCLLMSLMVMMIHIQSLAAFRYEVMLENYYNILSSFKS